MEYTISDDFLKNAFKTFYWDEQTIFQFYEEYNSEVLKAQLDKNMEDVYPSVNEDENLDVQESAYKI